MNEKENKKQDIIELFKISISQQKQILTDLNKIESTIRKINKRIGLIEISTQENKEFLENEIADIGLVMKEYLKR